MDLIRKYFAPTGNDRSSKMHDFIRTGAFVVSSMYGLGVLYRSGAMKYMMPPLLYNPLVRTVEMIKSHTEPIVDKVRYRMATMHLIRTYGLVSSGILVSVAGTCLFFKFPEIPVGVSIVGVVSSSIALIFLNEYMIYPARMVCFYVMCFSSGVSFGPMNWIAFDSLSPLIMVVGSTAIGFTVPLFLTRGVVSYFMSAQLLSSSLSIISAGCVTCNKKSSNLRLDEDINVMLTLQMLATSALTICHTIPTIYQFLNKRNSIQYLKSFDSVRQATIIFGIVAYTIWSAFRNLCMLILKRLRKERKRLSAEEKEMLSTFDCANLLSNKNISTVSSSVIFIILYARLVTRLQSNNKADARQSFEHLRKVIVKVSPVSFV
eukprot:Tbor_TRINITY_DN5883_c1_g7::TRINITY_DN5883_c1_g7_i1::g.6509::m.6509